MIHRPQKIQVWVIWLIAVLVTLIVPVGLEGCPTGLIAVSQAVSAGAGVVIAEETGRELFPWLPAYRWRKQAWQSYRRWRQACRQARYRYLVALALARMARSGVLSLAWVLDLLTWWQMRRYLGAIPVLYSVLEELQVAEVIDHYAPTGSDLEARKKVHRQLLELTAEADLRRHPLTAQQGRYGYGSRAVAIPFEHEGQRAVHRGLVILSGPMRFALRRSRAKQFRALWPAKPVIAAPNRFRPGPKPNCASQRLASLSRSRPNGQTGALS